MPSKVGFVCPHFLRHRLRGPSFTIRKPCPPLPPSLGGRSWSCEKAELYCTGLGLGCSATTTAVLFPSLRNHSLFLPRSEREGVRPCYPSATTFLRHPR